MLGRRLAAVSVLAVSIATVALLLPVAQPRAVASGGAPKLTLIGGDAGTSFKDMSSDGTHVWVQTSEDLLTGEGYQGTSVWDAIAGHVVELAPEAYHYQFGMASNDSQAITFRTQSPLVPEDTNAYPDWYLRTAAGVRLLPALDRTRFILDGGRLVVFATTQQMTSADTDSRSDDYLWDASTDSVRLLSNGPDDPAAHAATEDGSRIILVDTSSRIFAWSDDTVTYQSSGSFQLMSDDGARIYVSSQEQHVADDTDAEWDAYVVTDAGHRLLSPDQAVQAGFSYRRISPDGSRWVLSSYSPLLGSDTDLKHDNYLATDESLFLLPGGTEDAWVMGGAADLSSLVIQTSSALVAEDIDGLEDLYRWSASDPESVTLLTSGTSTNWQYEPTLEAVSTDGRTVIFVTEETLVPEDEPEIVGISSPDLYEWHDGALTNLAPGATRGVQFEEASADAQRVAFTTKSALVEPDTGTGYDLYISDRDITPPVATIAGPSGTSTATSVSLRFGTADDDGLIFECALDEAAYRVCPATTVVTDLVAGSHTAAVKAFDRAGNASTPVSVSWTVGAATASPSVTPVPDPSPSVPTPTPTPTPSPTTDVTPPTGSISIANGATYAKSTTVSVSTAATDAGSGLSLVALSHDGKTWYERTYAPTGSVTLPATNGARTVYAKWRDKAGNWSEVKSDTIVLDTVAPTVTPPRRGFAPGTAISSGMITLRVPWSGTDTTSGIARYELAQQTDGGAWTTVATNLTSAAFNRVLATERTYSFRVRAIDRAGNVAAWVTGPPVRVSRFSEHNSRITSTGTWETAQNTVYWGGATRHASKAGATVSLKFTGRSIAWIARTGPDRGKAEVLVNGNKVGTVDLYAPTYGNQRLVWVGSWTVSASRTITIRVLGTAGRPRVDLDALVTAD